MAVLHIPTFLAAWLKEQPLKEASLVSRHRENRWQRDRSHTSSYSFCSGGKPFTSTYVPLAKADLCPRLMSVRALYSLLKGGASRKGQEIFVNERIPMTSLSAGWVYDNIGLGWEPKSSVGWFQSTCTAVLPLCSVLFSWICRQHFKILIFHKDADFSLLLEVIRYSKSQPFVAEWQPFL